MRIKVAHIEGYNNAILIEKIVPKKGEERRSEGGVILPETAKPTHVWSRVIHVGWSCSRRIEVGDLIIAEKAANTTLVGDNDYELQIVRETDILARVRRENVPAELRL